MAFLPCLKKGYNGKCHSETLPQQWLLQGWKIHTLVVPVCVGRPRFWTQHAWMLQSGPGEAHVRWDPLLTLEALPASRGERICQTHADSEALNTVMTLNICSLSHTHPSICFIYHWIHYIYEFDHSITVMLLASHLHTPPTALLCSSCTAACPRQPHWRPRQRETATDWSDGPSVLVWNANRCSSALC